MSKTDVRIVQTTCASHCGGSCVLKLHVKDGAVVRVETDDGVEPQLRACLRGRAYRQRTYAPDRLLYPMKRIGERGEGRFERITWEEAIDTIARQITRVKETHGPASILYLSLGGDLVSVNNYGQMQKLLAMAGGNTNTWGITSFQGAIYAQQMSYGNIYTTNTRDDLVNSRLILLWGWNPATTIGGVNTNYFLMKAKEAGTKIIAIDPRFTDSAGIIADEWHPIRPATDGAALLGMAHVIISEKLQDQKYIDTYTIGFEKFRDYVTGAEDGIAKTPAWAAAITGIPADNVVKMARQYATMRPAALLAGIAPGRTANGDQYHRIAIALAAITGNVGVHGGDAAGRSWESIMGGYPYKFDWFTYMAGREKNVVDDSGPRRLKGSPSGYRASRVHICDVPDFIEKGKAGGFPADCRLIGVVNFSYLNSIPNVNKVAQALKSKNLEFIFVQEQTMTPTAKHADIVLPTNTFWERNDFAPGVGLAFYGSQQKAIDSIGESKSQTEIAVLLAKRLGLAEFGTRTDEDWMKEMVPLTEIPDYDEFRSHGVYRLPLSEPHVALKPHIDDPANNPFPTPSGKIEIYSQRMADLDNPDIPPIPKYVDAWEGWNDPLRAKYPLQMISTHFKRRANNQFENIPWLRELERHAVMINAADAAARGIKDGASVRVFNDRGEVVVPALVTERIMPGVIDLPQGAWFAPDEKGTDRGGCSNVLTSDRYSPGGSLAYNSCLAEVAAL